MFSRLEATLGAVTPGGLLGLDDESMRRCGFTRQKADYARELARAVLAGEFSLDAGRRPWPTREAVAALSGRRGIGEWTAENYLIWALGRRDVFPAGDLALRLGWQEPRGEGVLPSPEALRARWPPPGPRGAPRRPSSSGTTTSRQRGRGLSEAGAGASGPAQDHPPVGGHEPGGGQRPTEGGALDRGARRPWPGRGGGGGGPGRPPPRRRPPGSPGSRRRRAGGARPAPRRRPRRPSSQDHVGPGRARRLPGRDAPARAERRRRGWPGRRRPG